MQRAAATARRSKAISRHSSRNKISNSNGYNTYVGNNCWADPQCKQTVRANNPGNWQVTSTEPAGNGAVMTYPNVQQLTNNWDGSGFNGFQDVPLSALSVLSSSYTETTPHDASMIAQAAWDVWISNAGSHSNEIMIWVDNVGRGSGGADQRATCKGSAKVTFGSGADVAEVPAEITFHDVRSTTQPTARLEVAYKPTGDAADRYRDLVHVDDVTDVLMAALNRSGTPSQIYNVGTGRKTTVRELLRRLIDSMGLPKQHPIEEGQGSASDVFGSVADARRAQSELGWTPQVALETGLPDMVAWAKSQR